MPKIVTLLSGANMLYCEILLSNIGIPLAEKGSGLTGINTLSLARKAFVVSTEYVGLQSIRTKSYRSFFGDSNNFKRSSKAPPPDLSNTLDNSSSDGIKSIKPALSPGNLARYRSERPLVPQPLFLCQRPKDKSCWGISPPK